MKIAAILPFLSRAPPDLRFTFSITVNTIASRTSNVHIVETKELPSPRVLCDEIPHTDAQNEFVSHSRCVISDILNGDDPRFLMVIGPCSIHDARAGREYAENLAQLADEVSDVIYTVMRVYFEKPRTTVGWKGLIMDPHLDGTNDIAEGLAQARHFLREVVDCGLPTATELLDPITPQYIADLISWSAIGARTTESQIHRQMASGLSMPLGFKNGTDGSVGAALNAIEAGLQPQSFLGVSEDGVASAVSTTGNPDCHLILRGGAGGPNYDADSIKATLNLLEGRELPTGIMVDASHGNSSKDYRRQPAVMQSVIEQRRDGQKALVAAMVESNLVEGNQKFPRPKDELVYGQSITDGCIGWQCTQKLMRDCAALLR